MNGEPGAPLEALDAGDKVEIIIHRDKGGVKARVHAGYIEGRALKRISQGEGGALLLDAVERCARAIYQAGAITGAREEEETNPSRHAGW